MTLIVKVPSGYEAERRYVIDVVVSEWLGLDYDLLTHRERDVRVSLAGAVDGAELVLPDVLFATPEDEWLTERSMPALPLRRALSGDAEEIESAFSKELGPEPMPVLFGNLAAVTDDMPRTSSGAALSIDVFGSVFFLLSRYEEVVRPTVDNHQRFPASASIAAVEGFIGRPLADEYVDLLWSAMHSLWPILVRRSTTFRLRLTHDVDHAWAAIGRRPGTVAHAVAGDLLRRRSPTLAARRTRAYLAGLGGRVVDDPFDTFELLMSTSERHRLQSTFYFMAGGTAALDGSYRLTDPRIVKLLRQIHERGHAVGLHASYGTFDSVTRIGAEFDALRAACRIAGFEQSTWGVRQHYLRFKAPETWRHHEAVGLEHDSTLGFADRIGFRAGTGREFTPYDLLHRRPIRVRERPLVVMDATLLEYMAVDPEDATARAGAVVDRCREHGTDAVVLYHNSSLPGPLERAYYRGLVDRLHGDR